MTILIAEDEKACVELAKRLLCLSEMPIREILVTDQLEDALEKARTRPIDIIILDLTLRSYDGGKTGPAQALEAIPELDQHAPVIVMSGQPAEEYMVKCHAAGAMAYLPKRQFLSVSSAAFFYHTLVTAKLNWTHSRHAASKPDC